MSDDAYQEIYDKVYPPIPTDDANDRDYNATNLGTWASLTDVETFLSRYNHDSNYYYDGNSLACGNYVTIYDGTYNATWMIAGFDVESSRIASDGSVYDNGYGIALVPVTQLGLIAWKTSHNINGAYKSSTMHTTTLPTVATNLKKVLGTHLISRNVLLSSSISGNISNAYAWTTAYCTCMSIGQMTGTFASYRNKYDDGEANYKLPVFNKTSYVISQSFWSRGVYGFDGSSYGAWSVYSDGYIGIAQVNGLCGMRPLIYIR